MVCNEVIKEAKRYKREELFSLSLALLEEYSKYFEDNPSAAQSAVVTLNNLIGKIRCLSEDKQLYYRNLITSAEQLREFFMHISEKET